MVNKKITELTELTTPASADVVAIVDDPAGTPETKKITYSNLQSNLSITASQVSDFDTEVSNNTDVTANTAKVTNATHTGDVTGSNALTIGLNKVNDTHIDWGTGVNQVNTADIPELTNLFYTEARVNANGSVSLNTTHRTGDGSDHADVSTNTTNITNLSGVVVTVSGALVSDIADLTATSGAYVATSGALVSDIADLVAVSGAGVTVSGATVTNAGNITTNTNNITNLSGVVVTVSGAGATHSADSSDPHGATLTQTNISSTGLISGTTLTCVVGDHGTKSNPELVNVVYDSGATPPTASNTTEGTLFIQYTP